MLVAEIKMLRTLAATDSFLVLEGRDDVLFWDDPHRRHGSCRLIDGNGKNNVVGCLQRLDEIEFAGVLGLVDSDDDQLVGRLRSSENIVATDAHDLECMLCKSSALELVLAKLGDRQKVGRFEQDVGQDVRSALLCRGLSFGRLRWAIRQIDTTIASLAVRCFVDEQSWTVDVDKLFEKTAKIMGIEDSILRHQVAQLPEGDPWHVVQGHELIELLCIGLRQKLGNLPASIGVKQVGHLLRAAMPKADLRSTTMWRDMRRWEVANRPYQVLATEVTSSGDLNAG